MGHYILANKWDWHYPKNMFSTNTWNQYGKVCRVTAGGNFLKSSSDIEFYSQSIPQFFFITPDPLQTNQMWATLKFKLKNYVKIKIITIYINSI